MQDDPLSTLSLQDRGRVNKSGIQVPYMKEGIMEEQAVPFLSQYDEFHLKKYFQKALHKKVLLTITDNSTSMISVREHPDSFALRLHHIFLNADLKVLDEIVSFVREKGGNTQTVKAFIQKNKNCLKASPPRTVTINPKGRIYNLTHIFSSLNRKYFNDSVSAHITWGKGSPRYAVRRRTLGSYQEKTKIIRINPLLDGRRVPRYVVEFIVYHEMLHVVIDPLVKNGRRVIHSKEFKKREREYDNYHKAMQWEKRAFKG